MNNPYEPPIRPDRASFWKRLKRATHLAYQEFRAGVIREKLTFAEITRSCLMLLLISGFLIFGLGLLLAGVIKFVIQDGFFL
jgi:hypothetical protein